VTDILMVTNERGVLAGLGRQVGGGRSACTPGFSS
jgi:hypothetical protein